MPVRSTIFAATLMVLAGCQRQAAPENDVNAAANAATPAPAAPAEAEAAAILVSEAWIAAGPTNAAIYLTIDNDGGADRLTAIDGKGLGPITLHQSSMAGGVMRMRALPGGIAVAAHGQTKLAPMGLHAMIEPLARPLRPGDEAMLTLRFERQGEVEVTAPIRGPGETM